MNYRIFCDGGARGNPGPAACGCVIEVEVKPAQWRVVARLAKFIGQATNNQAEYQAVLLALNHLKANQAKLKADQVSLNLDSELVTKQLRGEYRVKHIELKPLFWQVRELVLQLVKVEFYHISRAKNSIADRLVNLELNKHQ